MTPLTRVGSPSPGSWTIISLALLPPRGWIVGSVRPRALMRRSMVSSVCVMRPDVAVGLTGGGRHIPDVVVLRGLEVAQHRVLRGINVVDQDMGIVDAADFVVVNILGAQCGGDAVHGGVRLLRDGLLDLDLKNQVSTALQVEAELDLVPEIVLDLREGGRKRRIAEKEIETEKNDSKNEQRFPFEIGIHG